MHAFDVIAATYDTDFTNTRLGRWLRQAVWEHLDALFQPGAHVLELGCGTGEDAIHLARRGVRVTATDVSKEMLAIAQHKAKNAGVAQHVNLNILDLNHRHGFHSQKPGDPNVRFDGAFSNFGALNCIEDRRALASALAEWVCPGGTAVLVLMSPFCPWEIAWHLARGEPDKAFRRLRNGDQAALGDTSVPVWYPSPRRLQAEFAPWFQMRAIAGIGALLPPPYLETLSKRFTHQLETLALLEKHYRACWPWTWLNDHYLMVFERNS